MTDSRIRTNDDWLSELRGHGPEREAAFLDLRAVLMRGLRVALRGRFGDSFLDDCVQESLMRINGKLDTFRGEGPFINWALAIAVRITFDHLRHQAVRGMPIEAVTASDEEQRSGTVGSGNAAEKAVARKKIQELLWRTLHEELTEKQRTVLMAELQGLPQVEIAMRLGTNRNNVYKLGHDGRRSLKKALTASGMTSEYVKWVFSE